MKVTSIIRQRGQLTIPESIRKIASWTMPSNSVSISLVKPDEIVIKPKANDASKEEIWHKIKQAQNIKGKGNESAIDFLQKDRNTH